MSDAVYGIASRGVHKGEYTRCRAVDVESCPNHVHGSHERLPESDVLAYNERVIADGAADGRGLLRKHRGYKHEHRRSLGSRIRRSAKRTIVAAIAVTCLFPMLSACGSNNAYSGVTPPDDYDAYSQDWLPTQHDYETGGNSGGDRSDDSSTKQSDGDESSWQDKAQELYDKGKDAVDDVRGSETYQKAKKYASEKAGDAMDALAGALAGSGSQSVDGGSGSTSQYMSISKEQALSDLNQVRIAESDDASYSRADYKHWVSSTSAPNHPMGTPGCMNVRNAIIARAGQQVQLSSNGCKVESATITDPYGAGDLSISEVDIDHVVPLEYVNQHGGASWSAQRKQDYANDMSQGHLLAVSSSANRQKGSKGPAEWMPAANQCEYAKSWAGTLQQWDLTTTRADWNKLNNVIQQCAA